MIRRKHTCNCDYFENIDSHNKSYIFGFITADGHVGKYNLQITLHEKDKDVLEFIKEELNYSGDIKKKRDNIYRLEVTSKKICDDLRKLGLSSNKTKDLEFPNIGNGFNNSFILGFFDGDGCINIRKDGRGQCVKIICLTNFAKDLQSTLYNLNIPSTRTDHCKVTNMSFVNIYKKEDLKSFYNILYKDSSFSIKRKREKFLQLFN